MTIKSIRTGWTGISALAGNDQWFSDFESIASVTVGAGGSSTISFTSVPSTYQHLQIRGIARTDRNAGNDFFRIRFNSDSGANYKSHELYGDGSSPYSRVLGEVNEIAGPYATASTATADRFGVFIIDVLDYANTNKNKTVRSFTGFDLNGSGVVSMFSGFRNNTEAINSISISPLLGTNFVVNSHFALYGIRG